MSCLIPGSPVGVPACITPGSPVAPLVGIICPGIILGNFFNDTAYTATDTCPEGFVGPVLTFTVEIGTIQSEISVADANAQAALAAQAGVEALRLLTPCEIFIPPEPPDFLTNDYAGVSGAMVSVTHISIVVIGTPAFVDGADGAPVGDVTFTGNVQGAAYTPVIVTGQDAFVDGADGVPVGDLTFTGNVQSATYTVVIVSGQDAFVDGADGAPVGNLTLTGNVQGSVYTLVILEGQDAFVDGVEGAPVGALAMTGSVLSASYF